MPLFSKNEVRKAGKMLAKESCSDEEMHQRLGATLGAVTVVAQERQFEHGAYCLMEIDYKQQSVVLSVHDESEEDAANRRYAELEQENRLERETNPMRDVLLTKVSSLKNLQDGYPNYLSDISLFLTRMDGLLGLGGIVC